MTAAPTSTPDGVRRSARVRGVVAIVLAVFSAIGVLVTLDLWKQTAAAGMVSLPSNLLLTVAFAVAAVRSFALARRGGHTEGSAAVDRLIALAGLIVIFAMIFSAMTAAGRDGWIGLVLYAVILSVALETLLILNWKARSLSGPLDAQRPVGERRR